MKLGCHATELGVGARRILLPPSASLFSEHPKPISTNSSFPELLLLLDSHREWMLPNPASEIHKISLTKVQQQQQQQAPFQFAYSNNLRPTLGAGRNGSTSFYVVRDDLLHPLVNGNKARKLDALLPILQQYSATDVVTCGGCQSAHAAALAVSCVERGIRPHLLLRGEQPQVPTGYNLVSLMYGNTTYISRSLYARREEMLNKHAELVAGSSGSIAWVDDILGNASNNCTAHLNCRGSVLRKTEAGKDQRRVVVVNEGAGAAAGLLGVVRLVRYLSQFHLFGTEQHINIVLDAGTGTTAIGLALGAICLGLPWKVTAVMLADTIEKYKEREKCLISSFKRIYQLEFLQTLGGVNDSIVRWVERIHSRKFGNVLEGEIELCRQIARQTGILVDPVYTLAAWEHAVLLSLKEMEDDKVVMLHTGGTLGMFGLAQRYPPCFHSAEQAT